MKKNFKHKNKKTFFSILLLTLLCFSSGGFFSALENLPFASATTIFSDGFESGDLTAWTSSYASSGDSVAVNSTIVAFGSYSLQSVTNGSGGSENAYVRYDLASSKSEIYVRAYVYLNGTGIVENGDYLSLMRLRVGSTTLAHFGVRSPSGTTRWWMQCRDGTGYSDNYNSSVTITQNQWYYIEAHWKLDATTGGAELSVNGTKVISVLTKDTTAYGNVGLVNSGIAEASNINATTARVFTDNVVVADAPIGPVVSDTYTLAVAISSPANDTYTSSSVGYSVSTTGNETNPAYQINLYSGGVPVGSNLTSSSGSFGSLTNGTYTFACYAIGDHLASDYKTIVFTVAIPSGSSPTTVASTELINYEGFTSSQITSWITYCKLNNITEFTIRILAAYKPNGVTQDWSDGVFDSSAKSKVSSLVSEAHTNNITVNLDCHTWYTTWDTYFDDSASGYLTNRATYLNWITDIGTTFGSTPGVKAFMALNEPQWQYATTSENNFIISCVTTIQGLTSLPVSVRFMAGASPWESSHHYGASIPAYLDFYCINAYWNPLNPTVQINNSGEEDILDTLTAAHTDGKELWITEFGSSSSVAETQRAYVAAWVAYANSATDIGGNPKDMIDRIYCWASSPTATESYNIWTTSFTPKLAWYELGNDATPSASQYYITVNSAYGGATASSLVDVGSSYSTLVTSPYSGVTGVQYVCTGYSIDNGGAGVQYTGVSYTFTNIQTNHTIYYYWKTQNYLTTSTAYGSATGAGWYDANTNASLSISSTTISGGTGTQYIFSGWAGTGTNSYTGASSTYQINMTNPITETANWATQYYLTVTSPYNTTYGSGWYNAGSVAYAGLNSSYQYLSGVNYTFSSWSTGGTNYAQSDPIVMSGPQTATAYWTPGIKTYVIYANAHEGGTISPSGAVTVVEGASQTFTITANTGYEVSQVLVGGVNQGKLLSYTFLNVSSVQTIDAYFTPTSSNRPTTTLDLYFRSDSFTTIGVTGYGLDSDYTNTYITIPVSVASSTGTVTYGFRVYLVTSSVSLKELTSGAPNGVISLSSNFTGQLRSSWNCPQTDTILGLQALQVDIYVSTDGGTSWTAQASYISNVLMTTKIVASTWGFNLFVSMTQLTGNTTASFSFGDTTYRSGISGLVFQKPLESELQAWRLNQGDYIGFEVGAYTDVIGEAFWALIVVLIAGVLYFRYGHFGTVAFFFVLFGGAGGLAWLLVPVWAAAPLMGLLIIFCSFIVWRLIR